MFWITLIMGIISAIPELIKLVQEIVAWIHGNKDQAKYAHEFYGIVKDYHESKDVESLKARLMALHNDLAKDAGVL